MDSDSSPPLPPHVRRDRDRIDALASVRGMTGQARRFNASDSPGSTTSSPGSITGSPGSTVSTSSTGRRRRPTLFTNPAALGGGKRRTKKKCGGKKHKKSKTSKKRGHKKSKTHKKRSHKKRA